MVSLCWPMEVKSNSSSFYWYLSCIRYVTHDRVHCHWRWQCHDPLFASFDNWIKAPLTNSVMVWLLKLSHLMPGDHFLSGNIWIARCLQLLLVLLTIFRAYLTWISGYLGIYLAIVTVAAPGGGGIMGGQMPPPTPVRGFAPPLAPPPPVRMGFFFFFFLLFFFFFFYLCRKSHQSPI